MLAVEPLDAAKLALTQQASTCTSKKHTQPVRQFSTVGTDKLLKMINPNTKIQLPIKGRNLENEMVLPRHEGMACISLS